MKPRYKLLLLLLIIVSADQLKAQPFTLEPNIKPVELNFEPYTPKNESKAKGKISVNTLTQDMDTAYYFIKGLSMYSPTYFSLNTTDPNADIQINLCKENWKKFHRTGEVKGKGLWKADFKTEGDFGIMVVAKKKPVGYVLMVWSGDELKIDMPSVFKPAGAGVAGGGWFKKNMTLIIVAAAALLIIAFLLVKLKKKKS